MYKVESLRKNILWKVNQVKMKKQIQFLFCILKCNIKQNSRHIAPGRLHQFYFSLYPSFKPGGSQLVFYLESAGQKSYNTDEGH